ncbi:nuclease A inhibitor family protein [Persicitalea jodogahamensis]|nr:nuclease A inhibitor family protein [Persicitalea jodogahamensis]
MIVPLLENLLYPSESDEPIYFLCISSEGQREINVQEFAELLGLKATDTIVEELPERFWSPVTTERDWYEEEEKQRTARFVELKRILEENLEGIRYFEVGEVEVGLYLIGQSEGSITGLKTMAVRT